MPAATHRPPFPGDIEDRAEHCLSESEVGGSDFPSRAPGAGPPHLVPADLRSARAKVSPRTTCRSTRRGRGSGGPESRCHRLPDPGSHPDARPGSAWEVGLPDFPQQRTTRSRSGGARSTRASTTRQQPGNSSTQQKRSSKARDCGPCGSAQEVEAADFPFRLPVGSWSPFRAGGMAGVWVLRRGQRVRRVLLPVPPCGSQGGTGLPWWRPAPKWEVGLTDFPLRTLAARSARASSPLDSGRRGKSACLTSRSRGATRSSTAANDPQLPHAAETFIHGDRLWA
ncbi:hypothetical protein SAMN05216371_4383 [Streptomyces sp. TLI_053]|nr:hypothetical protein SAMN05216371_4383 [Streptomyces sp. TLI_053]